MFEFKSPPSQFRNIFGKSLPYGEWEPKYFLFEVIGNKQYLIVADHKDVRLFDQDFKLEPTNGIEVKGLMGLEKPVMGVAYKIHKLLTEQGIKERSK